MGRYVLRHQQGSATMHLLRALLPATDEPAARRMAGGATDEHDVAYIPMRWQVRHDSRLAPAFG